MRAHLVICVVAGFFQSGCAKTRFAGNSDKVQGPIVPAETKKPESPAPTEHPAVPTQKPQEEPPKTATPDPTPSLPDPCRNAVSTTGIVDAVSHRTYLLLSTQLGYDEAVKACAAKAMRLIFLNQELPDGVLACKQALGTLWLRPDDATDAGLTLWQPANGGTDDRNTPHWIICYR